MKEELSTEDLIKRWERYNNYQKKVGIKKVSFRKYMRALKRTYRFLDIEKD